MRYQVRADDDRVLDARFQIQGADIVYLARYGNKRGSGGKNSDYGEGLRLLLRRLKTRSIKIREVTVDSSQARKLPNNERLILSAAEAKDDVDQLFTRMFARVSCHTVSSMSLWWWFSRRPGLPSWNSFRSLEWARTQSSWG